MHDEGLTGPVSAAKLPVSTVSSGGVAALAHLRDLARDHTLILLTASMDTTISEAAVLAELLNDH